MLLTKHQALEIARPFSSGRCQVARIGRATIVALDASGWFVVRMNRHGPPLCTGCTEFADAAVYASKVDRQAGVPSMTPPAGVPI